VREAADPTHSQSSLSPNRRKQYQQRTASDTTRSTAIPTMSPSFNVRSAEQESIQNLLNERARIDAQLALLQPSTTPAAFHSQPGHPAAAHHHTQQDSVPRSFFASDAPMTRGPSVWITTLPRPSIRLSNRIQGRAQHDAPQLSRSLSQHSAPTMNHIGSKGSGNPSHKRSNPFSSNGRDQPPPTIIDTRRGLSTSIIESWQSNQDDPFYTLGHQHQLRRTVSQRRPDLEQVNEVGLNFGEHPDDFLARNAPTFTFSPTEMTPSGSFQGQTFVPSMPRHSPSSNLQTPATPSTTSLTTGTTFSGNMSRQSSMFNEAIGGIQMMHVNSSTSIFSDASGFDEQSFRMDIPFPGNASYPKQISFSEDQNLMLMGAGSLGDEGQYSTSFQPGSYSIPYTSDMRRSESSGSNSSVSSTAIRAKLQLQRQNLAAARPLMPKAESENGAMSRKSSELGGVAKNNQSKPMAISKSSSYVRPQHDRLFCTQCDEHPQGFRGPHELGRHQQRAHQKRVQKWICVEPTGGNIDPSLRPILPLSKCKACSSQQKRYGAYYNAAAHLRRAHFKPKARGRGKSTKVDKDEKRGGKAGGNWPEMNELKRWMKEVWVSVEIDQPQAEDDDEEDNECDGAMFEDDSTGMMAEPSTQSTTFNGSFLYPDSSISDVFTPASSFGGQSMHTQNMSMHFDMALPQNGIDHVTMAMQYDAQNHIQNQSHSGQTSGLQHHLFASSPPQMLMDEALTSCIETTSFTQNLTSDDQLGLDLFSHFSYTPL
jgi:hypothetical protein